MRWRQRRFLLRRPDGRRPTRVLPTVGLVLLVGALIAIGVVLIRQRTTLDDDGVEVGSGRLPSTVPADFPLPGGAVIGETSVDRAASTTVVELTTPGNLVSAVSSYTVGLVSGGYVVDRSEEAGDGWLIEFGRLDLRGTIELTETAEGVGSVLTIVDP